MIRDLLHHLHQTSANFFLPRYKNTSAYTPWGVKPRVSNIQFSAQLYLFEELGKIWRLIEKDSKEWQLWEDPAITLDHLELQFRKYFTATIAKTLDSQKKRGYEFTPKSKKNVANKMEEICQELSRSIELCRLILPLPLSHGHYWAIVGATFSTFASVIFSDTWDDL